MTLTDIENIYYGLTILFDFPLRCEHAILYVEDLNACYKVSFIDSYMQLEEVIIVLNGNTRWRPQNKYSIFILWVETEKKIPR